MNKILGKRFKELEEQMIRIACTEKESVNSSGIRTINVDTQELLGWCIKVKNLIIKVAGETSEHYKGFIKYENQSYMNGNVNRFKYLKTVFLATKEDFEGGYLSSYKRIVQAEIFDTELEQARELLKNGYYVAAAVITGLVLETTLRELCNIENITVGKMNKMNDDLAKAGVYNSLVQKQITALAGIRNSAAHGKIDEFTKVDVEQMIPAIEQFLIAHLKS